MSAPIIPGFADAGIFFERLRTLNGVSGNYAGAVVRPDQCHETPNIPWPAGGITSDPNSA